MTTLQDLLAEHPFFAGLGDDALGPAEPLPATGPPASGHLLGLGQVLALAGSLDRLNGSIRLVGVEAAGFEHGFGLSPAVAAAVPPATEAVFGLVRATAGRIGPCRPTTASPRAPSPPGA